MLHFLVPAEFPSEDDFLQEYSAVSTGSTDALALLQSRIEPYFLRRIKEDVERNLPARQETLIEVELSRVQKLHYKMLYEKDLSVLRKSKADLPSLNNLAMQLRKCCLTGDHRVLTSAGWKSIKEVQRGDEVLTFNMALTRAAWVSRSGDVQPATYSSNYQQEWKLVTDTTSHEADAANEADELYRMQGSMMDVIATRDHRMLLAHMNWRTETGLSLQTPFGYSTVGELLPRESGDDARRAVKYEAATCRLIPASRSASADLWCVAATTDSRPRLFLPSSAWSGCASGGGDWTGRSAFSNTSACGWATATWTSAMASSSSRRRRRRRLAGLSACSTSW